MEKPSGSGNQAHIKLVMIWVAIILLGSYWLTVKGTYDPVSITVMPESPRKGKPVSATFKLNNPHDRQMNTGYRFYADGELLKEGQTVIDPSSSKTYQYAYSSPVEIGERVSFTVESSSHGRRYEKTISVPPFPPQICSSFISFASFSTTVMSSMSTSPYYQENFSTASGVNIGLFISISLILLLIALELVGAAVGETTGAHYSSRPKQGGFVLRRFKDKFSVLTWILFIIFMGIVYTKIVMILSTG